MARIAREIGLVREVESEIARSSPTLERLRASLPGWPEAAIERAVQTLLAEGRVTREKKRLLSSPRYLVLSSDKFHHRIDALNHFLGGVTRAVAQRLIFEERTSSEAQVAALDRLGELIVHDRQKENQP